MPITLENAKVIQFPYLHALISNVMDINTTKSLLTWFENDANWEQKVIDDFYDIASINLRHQNLPTSLSPLVSTRLLQHLKRELELIFEETLSKNIDIQAQKMTTGNSIKIHTDFGPTKQSHRLIIQLNRGWTINNGGILLLLDSDDGSNRTGNQKYYLPAHNSGMAFKISSSSFHAVSPIKAGERFTLTYSFYLA